MFHHNRFEIRKTSAQYWKMKSTTGSLGRNKTQQANNCHFKLRWWYMLHDKTSCQRLNTALLSLTILLFLFISLKMTRSAPRVSKHMQHNSYSRAFSNIDSNTKTLNLELH